MEEKFVLENVQLSKESCFDFFKRIPDGSIDLVCIDPPYEVSRKTNFQSGEKTGKDTDRFRISMEFGEWDFGFTGLDLVIKECFRILRKGGTIICFYDLWKITNLFNYITEAKFKQLRFIEWVKTNPVPINSKTNYLTNSREIAVSAVKGGCATFNSEYDNGIYRFPINHEKGRFHATQKPLPLIEVLIEKHSNEGDTVLDCFSGSGTTACACISKNRKFIGCELDENYYTKSVKRISEFANDFINKEKQLKLTDC